MLPPVLPNVEMSPMLPRWKQEHNKVKTTKKSRTNKQTETSKLPTTEYTLKQKQHTCI